MYPNIEGVTRFSKPIDVNQLNQLDETLFDYEYPININNVETNEISTINYRILIKACESMGVNPDLIFKEFTDTAHVAQYTTQVTDFGSYIPGKFYQRELPGIVAVLDRITEQLDVVIIDGYVMLGDDRPGMGHLLWEYLDGQTAVIGVANSQFTGAHPVTIIRGQSRRPLYITAIGMNQNVAAENITLMAGSFRIPDLLRQADSLAKEITSNKT